MVLQLVSPPCHEQAAQAKNHKGKWLHDGLISSCIEKQKRPHDERPDERPDMPFRRVCASQTPSSDVGDTSPGRSDGETGCSGCTVES